MITLLFCQPGHLATKQFKIDGSVEAYDLGYRFEHASIPCSCLTDLFEILTSVADTPGVFAVRGSVLPDQPELIRRVCIPKPGRAPTLEGTEQYWVCWDFDRTDVPYDPADPAASAAQLVSLFPEGLKEAGYIWQSSSSQHLHGTFRGHIWQYLDRPYSDAELKTYAKRLPFGPDRSLFNPVQPHYICAPVFESGEDPLGQRIGLAPGLRDYGTILGQETNRLREQAQTLLDKACREIRAIKAGEARHPVVNRWSYALGQLCPHLLSELETYNRLQDATQAGKEPLPLARAADEIRRGLDDGKRNPKLAGESWKAGLEYEGKDFKVSGTPSNTAIILAHDPRWSGIIAYNERSQKVTLSRQPPFPDHLSGPPAPRDLTQIDGTRIAAWLAQEYRAKIGAKEVLAAVEAVAEENRYDPVLEWLEDLEWDGQPRLDRIAVDYLGATKPYEAEIFTRFCLSAVERAYQPGCVAQFTMILEGAEGIKKSSFLEALASRAWYAEVSCDLSSKDAIQYIHGPWISDFSEVAALKKTTQVEAMKDFLSRPYDRVRLPYKAIVVDLPRRGVFVGTTNEKQYLASRTGNRRIRPIYCHTCIPLPDSVRMQVWAEARTRYLAGESTWEIADKAALLEAQAERCIDPHDVWEKTIHDYLKNRDKTTISELLTLAVAITVDRQDNRAHQRATRVLLDLGWLRSRSSQREWRAPPGWVSASAAVSKSN